MIGRDLAGYLPATTIGLIAIVSAFLIPSLHGSGLWIWYAASLATGLVGLAFMGYARLPLYRQGKFLFIGPAKLPADRLPAYRRAWRLFGVTLCIQVLLFILTH